ncbi:MAG: flagellar biosynthetic protein FliR, partial [Christensenellales bacterium]
MEEIINSVTANVDYFVLMLLRISGLLISSPIFGRHNIPNMLKIAFCLLVTYITFAAEPSGIVLYGGAADFIL